MPARARAVRDIENFLVFARATGWVGEKIDQNVAQPIFWALLSLWKK
jgi:hypothetical protein